MKVLVVDDEPAIVETIRYNLHKDGYETMAAGDGAECLSLTRSEMPDLIILDVMLPTASGFDICRQIRKRSTVPILLLTARAAERDRVAGLEMGADDYVVKPFSMRELMARVRIILRRQSLPTLAEPVSAGDLTIDLEKYAVTVRGEAVKLSRREFDLLHFFVTHPEQVISRQTLLDRLWGSATCITERTVDVHIRWLREKIEANPSQPCLLLTVRGVGYRWSPSSETASWKKSATA